MVFLFMVLFGFVIGGCCRGEKISGKKGVVCKLCVKDGWGDRSGGNNLSSDPPGREILRVDIPGVSLCCTPGYVRDAPAGLKRGAARNFSGTRA